MEINFCGVFSSSHLKPCSWECDPYVPFSFFSSSPLQIGWKWAWVRLWSLFLGQAWAQCYNSCSHINFWPKPNPSPITRLEWSVIGHGPCPFFLWRFTTLLAWLFSSSWRWLMNLWFQSLVFFNACWNILKENLILYDQHASYGRWNSKRNIKKMSKRQGCESK